MTHGIHAIHAIVPNLFIAGTSGSEPAQARWSERKTSRAESSESRESCELAETRATCHRCGGAAARLMLLRVLTSRAASGCQGFPDATPTARKFAWPVAILSARRVAWR